MQKIRSLFILGILTVFLPFLGFPATWKSFFTIAIGILISFITFLHYKEIKKKFRMKEEKKRETPVFVENRVDGSIERKQ